MFAAMDCTIHRTSCTAHDVSGYPTFKYFNYGKNAQKYMGGREVSLFTYNIFVLCPLSLIAIRFKSLWKKLKMRICFERLCVENELERCGVSKPTWIRLY
jgi:hypothetical protein